MIKKYFLQQYLHQQYVHGGVTSVDVEKTLLANGFEPIFFPGHDSFSVKAKLSRLFFLVKKFASIKRNSVVVFVFPFYARMDKLLIRLLRVKKVKLICFIVDIDGIKDGNDTLLAEEIRFFQQLKYFIVLNAAMKKWLEGKLPSAVSSPIHFHTFLTKPVHRERQKSFQVVFAGNLAKSPFLEQLHLLKAKSPELHFHIYGPDPTPGMVQQENVTYHGVEQPYALPNKLPGSFGLIWEGLSIDKPEGSIGNYIQYITHHKLSLYIVSGLPVIVPATAGTAPLVEKFKIGFTVNSLYEVEEKIRAVSQQQYMQMQANLVALAEKVSKGEFLVDAVNDVMQQIPA